MKYIPIIAIVSEDTFHALKDHVQGQPPVPPALQEIMEVNGWSINAMCAGVILKAALEHGVERP